MSAIIEKKSTHVFHHIVLLFFFIIALFFFMAFMSFNNEDAGWTHSGSLETIKNICGLSGAWVADIGLSLFGLMAYFIPIIILWHGHFFYHRFKQSPLITLSIYWLGYLITMVSGCAIFYLHILRLQLELPRSTGGILGQEMGDILLLFLDDLNATLLLSAVLVIGVTLVMGWTWVWINLFEFVGKYTLFFFRVIFIKKNKTGAGNKVKSKSAQTIKISPVIRSIQQYEKEIEKVREKRFRETLHNGELSSQELLNLI